MTVAQDVDDAVVLERTGVAMAREVGAAVLAGAAPPATADAAVERAFGFPTGRGGLAVHRRSLVPSRTP